MQTSLRTFRVAISGGAGKSDADQDSTTPGTQFAVIRGTTIDIPFTVANNGNLREDVEVNVSVEGGWEVSPDNTPLD